MNQELIGKYISKKRKQKGLTQKELANNLNISEKTISKWECGNGLPEVSLMQPLCNELDITVNELLSGEDLKNNNNDKVIDYKKYKDNKNHKIIAIIIIIFLLITLSLLTITQIKYQKFYDTNYNNNKVTELYGESKNLFYDNLVIIESPSKTIAINGNIDTLNNEKVPRNSIYKYTLRYKDRIIYGGGIEDITKMKSFIAEEPIGYNEMFTEEALKNKDKWEIDIFYKIDDKKYKETIKLKKRELLSTNQYKKERVDSITENNEKDNTNSNELVEKDDICDAVYKGFINKLLKKGFKKPIDACELYIELGEFEAFTVIPNQGRIVYNTPKYILSNMYRHESYIIYFEGDLKNNLYRYEYNVNNKKQKCTKGECPKIDKSQQEAIDKFIELINKYLKDDTE